MMETGAARRAGGRGAGANRASASRARVNSGGRAPAKRRPRSVRNRCSRTAIPLPMAGRQSLSDGPSRVRRGAAARSSPAATTRDTVVASWGRGAARSKPDRAAKSVPTARPTSPRLIPRRVRPAGDGAPPSTDAAIRQGPWRWWNAHPSTRRAAPTVTLSMQTEKEDAASVMNDARQTRPCGRWPHPASRGGASGESRSSRIVSWGWPGHSRKCSALDGSGGSRVETASLVRAGDRAAFRAGTPRPRSLRETPTRCPTA